MQDGTNVKVRIVGNDRLRLISGAVEGYGPRGLRAEMAVKSLVGILALQVAVGGRSYEDSLEEYLALVEAVRLQNTMGWPEGGGV